MLGPLLERTLRQERATLLAGLFRLTRDLELAEESLQEACLQATTQWQREGLPDNPAAWLNTVARRRAVDVLRRRSRAAAHEDDDLAGEGTDAVAAQREVDDEDRLRLLFECCRASLPERARAGLALRSFLGLTTREIARAFLEREATTAQRMVRAKQQLEAEGPAQAPASEAERARALSAVLSTLYLLFNEGYLATEGDSLVRRELSREALKLTRGVVSLVPREPEAAGLLALMLFHEARQAARVNAQGELITLEEQDRSRWDQRLIQEGAAVLDGALRARRPGVYQLQAAIASLHCHARTAADTDWPQIAALYGKLLELEPTPIVELNAAVALAFAARLEDGLRWLNALERRGVLNDYHLLPAAKAELLRRQGKLRQANRYFRRARRLCRNAQERAHLDRRIRETDEGARGDAS